MTINKNVEQVTQAGRSRGCTISPLRDAFNSFHLFGSSMRWREPGGTLRAPCGILRFASQRQTNRWPSASDAIQYVWHYEISQKVSQCWTQVGRIFSPNWRMLVHPMAWLLRFAHFISTPHREILPNIVLGDRLWRRHETPEHMAFWVLIEFRKVVQYLGTLFRCGKRGGKRSRYRKWSEKAAENNFRKFVLLSRKKCCSSL